jgi:hypothetical protein
LALRVQAVCIECYSGFNTYTLSILNYKSFQLC